MPDNEPDHVAIVDDDRAVLASVKSLLQAYGYRVRAYASAAAFPGDQGRRAACMILNHHMPKMTGLELVAQFRTAGAHTPVLIVTALPSPSIVVRAAQLSVERVVSKPLREDDLWRFVNAHYCVGEGRAWGTPAFSRLQISPKKRESLRKKFRY